MEIDGDGGKYIGMLDMTSMENGPGVGGTDSGSRGW
jgi:hypothetical protein